MQNMLIGCRILKVPESFEVLSTLLIFSAESLSPNHFLSKLGQIIFINGNSNLVSLRRQWTLLSEKEATWQVFRRSFTFIDQKRCFALKAHVSCTNISYSPRGQSLSRWLVNEWLSDAGLNFYILMDCEICQNNFSNNLKS